MLKGKVVVILAILLSLLLLSGCDSAEEIISDTHNLTIEVDGEGTVDPAEGTHEFEEDATVTLKAIPAEGWEFSHWTGEVTDTESSDTTVLMDQDKSVTAHFTEKAQDNDLIDSTEMVFVESGTTSTANGSVTIDHDFYIGKYHVTQADFEEIMGFNPSYFNDDDHPDLTGNSVNRPVERVTWYDAVMYCNKLSEAEGLDKYYNISSVEYSGDRITDAIVTENKDANGYRLPTADEHEYAARGGKDGNATTYAGSDNLDEVGWYTSNSEAANSERSDNRGTMPAGEKEDNELGIYDMSGNVLEWTNTTSGSNRIVRGGSWYTNADYCEVSNSFTSNPSGSGVNVGFRLTRSP